ncbi:terminase small subunit [Endozoicomonas sp. SESOKO1]|uniref:terminase small subunit n=1 Tax=Endozoicomonas sp. SESOKO1 TaxID=2828742 RepID=UPI0021471F67
MNVKQERFVNAYLMDGNATRAAREAGYSERSAHTQGNRMLKNDEVLNAIAERTDALQQEALITAESKRDTLWRIAQFNAQVIADDEGQLKMRNPRAATAAISELNKMDGDYRKNEGPITQVNFIQDFGGGDD